MGLTLSWLALGPVCANAAAGADPVVYPGEIIFLRTFNGNHLDVKGETVLARRNAHTLAQKFVIKKFEEGAIYSGDTIYLTAHTGRQISVRGDQIFAETNRLGVQEALILERLGGNGVEPLRAGDTIFFKADTGNYIEVDLSGNVRARFDIKT